MKNKALDLCLLALLLLLAPACGSSNKCKKACKKISQCYGETGGAPSCTLSAACSPKEECQAACINDATCETLMGQDPTGQQALLACAAKCAALPEGDRSIILTEGSMPFDFGPPHEGGPSYDVYQPADLFVPQADLPPGPARGKFCNDLLLEGQKFTATFKLGTPPNQWTIQAFSGECQPQVNITCPVIPTGTNLALEITDGTQTIASGNSNGTIKPGEEWAFIATVDASSQFQLQAGPFQQGYPCQTTDLFAGP